MEFSKTFDAQISIVKTRETPIDLLEIAENMCNTQLEIHKPSYELLEVKVERKKPRKQLRENAEIIRDWIKEKLLNGEPVRLKDLSEKFACYDLTLSAFSNHFTAVKKELTKKGYEVKKIGQGKYQL